MRCALYLAVLASGCGFTITAGSSVGGDGAVPGDAIATGDGAEADADPTIDAPMVEACTVRPTGGTSLAGLLGGSSGNQSGTVTCPAGQLAIGLGFETSPNPIAGHGNHILMTTIRLYCGTVARSTSNVITTIAGATSQHTALMGSSPTACDAYKPPATLAPVMCPMGQVLVGLAGHQVDTTLYNDLSIRCAALASDGTVTGTVTTFAIASTGTNATMPEETTCGAGLAIVSIAATSGCGQDGATATCSALACTP